MPRTKRLVNGEEKAAYHIMSRTALDGFPFGDMEKDELFVDDRPNGATHVRRNGATFRRNSCRTKLTYRK